MLVILMYIVVIALVLDILCKSIIPNEFKMYYLDDLNLPLGGLVVWYRWVRFYK